MIFHLSLWNVEKMLKKKEKEEIHGSLRQRQRPTGIEKKSHAPSLSPGIACLFGYRGQTDGVKHPANRLTAGIGVREAVWKRLGWRKWIVWWTSRMPGRLCGFSPSFNKTMLLPHLPVCDGIVLSMG
jgi:hypothetical protein